MKLRNKKTGEIIEVKSVQFLCRDEDGHEYQWSKRKDGITIAELNEDWENYEEPKEVWYIDFQGVVRSASKEENDWFKENEIGNYFETKEEAEKAVEKLKAFKRLKDKKFKFYGWNKGSLLTGMPNNITFACNDTRIWAWEDLQDDLDLLFGGEE